MALFGTLATLRDQAPRDVRFATAFAYVDDLLHAGSVAYTRLGKLGAGESHRTELAGGVFAIEQVYETKPRAQGFFESHRKFIDLQVVVAGDEVMEVVDLSSAVVRQPYEQERDLIVYQDVAVASSLRIASGHAAIFFPVDVHMPSLQSASGRMLVRKSVVKIPVG